MKGTVWKSVRRWKYMSPLRSPTLLSSFFYSVEDTIDLVTSRTKVSLILLRTPNSRTIGFRIS